VHRWFLTLAALALLLAVLAPAALATTAHVRVEGKSRTIYGAAEPVIEVPEVPVPCPVGVCAPEAPTALSALDAASARGEFYYHVADTSFGAYVDQIGRFPADNTSGWVFKVDGVSPPIGADQVHLKAGDRVLWYWATFGPTGGPPTLVLRRTPHRCYRVLAQDDQGKTTPARGAVLSVDGRHVRTRGAAACIGPHRGLVRATLAGAVRSNALR
jgi:hypothetical protein